MADEDDDTEDTDTDDEEGEVLVAPRPVAQAPAKGTADDEWETVEAPKGTKAAPAKAAPTKAEGAPDFGEDWEVVEGPKKEPKEKSWEITKAFRHGVGGTAEAGAAAARAAGYAIGDTEKEAKEGSVQGALDQFGKWASGDQDIRVQSVADIHSANDALDYVLQNVGQAAGSSLAPLIGGILGATAGSAVPVVGTTVGGLVGAGAASIPLGIGTVFKALEDDKEIQDKVKKGELNWNDLARASVPYGVAVGSLDLMGEAAIARVAGLHNIGKEAAKDLIKEEVKQTLKKRLLVGGLTSAASEGATEGFQQGIQEVAVAERGGQADLQKSAMSILDSVLGGIIGGGAAGAAGGAFQVQPKKAGEEKDGSPKTGAEDQKPGQTGTGVPHGDDASSTAPGTSTPGGAAPGPAAQPAGKADQETTQAPPSETPPTGVGKATPSAQPPPTGGVADPSLAAGLQSAVGEEEDEGDLTPEQEALAAARKSTQGVTDPDAALALQDIAPPATAPPATAAPPSPAVEPPAVAPTTTPPPAGPEAVGAGVPIENVPPPAPLATPAVQPPVAAAVQPAPAEAAPAPTPVGPEQAVGAAPGASPAEQPQTIPEAPATLEAQRQQLANGERKAVMYPKGTKPGKLPKGMAATVVKGDVYHFNPAQVLKEEVRNAAKEGRQNELLGLGPFNKEDVAAAPGPEMVVAERTPEGTEVRAAGAKPVTAPIQQAVMEAGKTPGNVVAPEPIEKTLAARQAEAPPAAPTAAPAPAPAPQPAPAVPEAAPKAELIKAKSPKGEAIKEKAKAKEKAPAPEKAPEPSVKALQTREGETVAEQKPALKAPEHVKELREKEKVEAAAEPAPVQGAAKKAPVVVVAKRRGIGPKTQAVIAKTQPAAVAPVRTREQGISDLREYVRDLLPVVKAPEEAPGIAKELEAEGKEKPGAVEFTARKNALDELMEDIGKEFEEHAGSVRGFVDDTKRKLNKGIVAHVYEKHVSNVEEQRRQEAALRQAEEARKAVEAHERMAAEDEARRKGEADQRDKGRVTATSPLDIHPEDARNRSLDDFITMVRRVAETATKKEVALPEYFQKAIDAIEARNVKRGGARASYDARIEAERKAWVAAVEKQAEEQQAKAAPEPTKEEKVAVEKELAEATAEEKEMMTDEAKVARAVEKGAADPLNAQAQAAIDKHLTQPVLASGDGPRIIAAAQAAVKEYGEELPKKALYTNPPWVNFLRSVAKRKRLDYDAMGNLLIGYSYLKEGKPQEYYDFVNGTKDEHGLQVDDYLREFHGEGQEKGSVEAGKSTGTRKQAMKGSDDAITSRMPAMRWKVGEAPKGWGEVEAAPKKPKNARRAEVQGNKIVNWETGNYIELDPNQETTATEAMKRSVPTSATGFRGIFGLLNRTIREELTKLVGDVRVHYVTEDDIRYLVPNAPIHAGIGGVFMPASLEAAARGDKGIILIAHDALAPGEKLSEYHSQVLLHEMAHAATEHAYGTNYKGTRDIIDMLHVEAKALAQALGHDVGKVYGLTNPHEFIAEGMANPKFQQFLNDIPVSDKTVRKVKALGVGGKPSVWRVFVGAVARIIRATWGGEKGMSSTEALMRTFEHMTRDDAAQRAYYQTFAGKDWYGEGSSIGVVGPKGQAAMMAAAAKGEAISKEEFFEHLSNRFSLAESARETVDALRARAAHDGTSWGRTFRDKYLSNTTDIQRRMERLLGPDHPIVKAMKAFLSTDAKRNELQRKGDEVAVKLADFLRKFPEAGKKLVDLMHGSTRAGVDFTQDITHKNNKYFNNQNSKFVKHRADHQRLHDDFKKLSRENSEVAALGAEMASYYTGQQDKMVTATVKRILETSLEHGHVTLPQGENIDTITQWVKSGDIDKGVKKQSDRDKALHKALPTIMSRLQDASEIREARGFYAPLARTGDFAVQGWKDLQNFEPWRPESEQEKGVDYLPKGAEATGRDELYFGDEKDYENYARTTDDQWKADPRIRKKGGFSAFVKVQKDHLSFYERKSEAEKARQDLIDSGDYRSHAEAKHNQISQVMHKDDPDASGQRRSRTTDQFHQELLPEHVKALLKSMAQSGLKGANYETAKQSVIHTHIQSMAGNRAAHHKLRRKFTAGESMDVVRAMRSYNMATSGYLANMEVMPTIQDGIDKMEADLRGHPGDPDYMRKQEGLREFKRRVDDVGTYRNNGLLRTFTNISYLNHLASPAFLAMQYLQPLYSTFPALAGHYGGGRSSAAIFRAYNKLNAGTVFARGYLETGKAALGRDTTDPIAGFLANKNLSAFDKKLLTEGIKRGLIDAEAGMEDSLRRLSDNPVDRFLGPMNNVLKNLTGGIEAVNRASTALAAAELGMKHQGMTEEQAIEHALDMVEQTQYNYGKANAPPILNHPLARVTLQFKKYALGLGNYMARQIYHGFRMGKNMTETQKMERRQALKSMAFMFATYAAFSGLSGALPWEIIKAPLMIISALLGKKEWGEWDRWMNEFQGVLARNFGKGTAEVLMRGLPRLLNLDLSNRINLSSLALFGDPKDPKKTDSVKAWLFDLFSGAPISMVMNALDAMQKGDYLQAIPGPKILKDVLKAWQENKEGKLTPGGKRISPPTDIGGLVTAGLGFRTAKSAENWEYGGGGYQHKEEQRAKDEKSAVTAPWHKADVNKDPEGRAKAWKDIQAWNKEHPKQRISMDDLIKQRNRNATDAAKEKRKLATTQ